MPSTTIESLKNSSSRCELLASRCSSTPSKDPHVEKEEYHPKCALSSRHSGQSLTYLRNHSSISISQTGFSISLVRAIEVLLASSDYAADLLCTIFKRE